MAAVSSSRSLCSLPGSDATPQKGGLTRAFLDCHIFLPQCYVSQRQHIRTFPSVGLILPQAFAWATIMSYLPTCDICTGTLLCLEHGATQLTPVFFADFFPAKSTCHTAPVQDDNHSIGASPHAWFFGYQCLDASDAKDSIPSIFPPDDIS